MGTERLNIHYETDAALAASAESFRTAAEGHRRTLEARSLPYTGWVGYASREADALVPAVERVAADIRSRCSAFVCIGIGGSYLGARAALDFIGAGANPTHGKIGAPAVHFAGFNLSGSYHSALLEALEGEEVCICQISKSGGTVEPGMAFCALRELLVRRYGVSGADARTYVVTDPEEGALRAEARDRGWTALSIPPDIGGRFSVLTPVGLLPLAVAGVDIRALLEGAASAETGTLAEEALRLACMRMSIREAGKTAEVIGCFEPWVETLIGWLLQLFGESEGKDGKGMLPQGVCLSRDLHSLGQFLQDGNQIFSEMLLDIEAPPADVRIESAGNPYTGRGMNEF
ncbi:MAG: glucose-6-phosphate isomerase, partial [Clostridiales Family XIII bacterium]|nr:glucose-6-phosphate isomerase [Clostridiales Family XIII bacterium]